MSQDGQLGSRGAYEDEGRGGRWEGLHDLEGMTGWGCWFSAAGETQKVTMRVSRRWGVRYV